MVEYIWHGYISLSKEESPKIDTPEKCIALIRGTFNSFLKDMKFNPDNIDLMCALHKDRPHHLHIHFEFWEKAPKYKGKDRRLEYRRKGKVEKSAIDAMFVRLGLAVSNSRDSLYKNRDAAIQELRQAVQLKNSMNSGAELKDALISLAKSLPKTGRIAYASRDMEPYRGKVDEIVRMLLDRNPKARKADRRFYEALEERKREIENICGNSFIYSDKNVPMDKLESALPEYHNAIDSKSIKIAEEIESDYKRRQGNLVLKLARLFGQADDLHGGGSFLRSAYYGSRFAGLATLGVVGGLVKGSVRAGKRIANRVRSKKSDDGGSDGGSSSDGGDRYTETPAAAENETDTGGNGESG